MKDIDRYGEWSAETAVYPRDRVNEYLLAGLTEEIGEVAGLFKREIRDDEWSTNKLEREMGDVLWYWVRICEENGLVPSKVMMKNIEKLTARKEQGKIHGKGSDR